MSTINSLDDLLKALDDNPAWREAVRARILGEELLQLPARFNALVEKVEAIAAGMNSLVQRLDSFIEEQRMLNEEQREFNEEHRAFNANTEARVGRIESDINVVKGGHVRTLLMDLLPDLIEELGFETMRVIRRDELIGIARRVSGATRDGLRSFRRADMVVQTIREQENTYLAIEASWTASPPSSVKNPPKPQAWSLDEIVPAATPNPGRFIN